ncbi:1-phosphatidylinositol-3-phosphate 5-kinase [Gonapodya sp. JEL0774]|nr:1-phosphatidylinositol-3-phosphate 5-kinase [Gonapodya sp. JEL0774]
MRICDSCKRFLDTSDTASSLMDGPYYSGPSSSLKPSLSTQQIAAAFGMPVEVSSPVAKRSPSTNVLDGSAPGGESPLYRMLGMGGSRQRAPNTGSDLALPDNVSIIEPTLAEDLVAAAHHGLGDREPSGDEDGDRPSSKTSLTAWATDSLLGGRGGRATPVSMRATSALAGELMSDEDTFELARPTSPNSRPLAREDSRRSATTRSSLKRRLRARASGSTGGKGIPRSYSGPLEEDSYSSITHVTDAYALQAHDSARSHRYRQSNSDMQSIHEVAWPPASMGFMRHLLGQLLQDDGIDAGTGWADIVLNLVTTASDRLRPNVREGDEMDIRHYLKIKTIAGGRPRESSYINGVVFSKSVAHKAMMRKVSPVRVLLLKFPLEFRRDGEVKFLSLDPVLSQEREYLRNLVARVADLEPDVVLVEKGVSRLALEFLLDQNIIVVHNVKESVLQKVARATRAQVVKSVGELSSSAVVGTCDSFDVKMFPDPQTKGGRKSYVVFSGGNKELQGTIVFRGGDEDLLKRIKNVTNFLLYAIYNLRLESSVLRDESLILPWFGEVEPLASSPEEHETEDGASTIDPESSRADESFGDSYYEDIGAKVKEAKKRFEGRVFSVTPNIRFEPPYVIGKILRELDRLDRMDEEYDDEFVSTVDVQLNMKLLNSYFSFPGLLDPLGHQNILVLFSLSSAVTHNLCQEPICQRIMYYGAYPIPEAINEVRTSDITLGGMIDSMVLTSTGVCPAKGCGRPYLDHIRRYSHADGRVSITMSRRPQYSQGPKDGILMWNTCKVCQKESAQIPMSNEASRYSFGKFLELMFHARGIRSSLELCDHDPTKYRSFSFAKGDVNVKFEYSEVVLWEVAPPPRRTAWNMRKLALQKQQDLTTLQQMIIKYYDSIADRVKMSSINDLVVGLGPRLLECKNQLSDFSRKIANEKKAMLDELLELSQSTGDFEYSTLWSIAPKLNQRVKFWDTNFDRLARSFFQPDARELGRVAGLRLRKVFTDRVDVHGGSSFERDVKDHGIDRKLLPKLASSPTSVLEFDDGVSVYSDAQSANETDKDDTTTNTNFEDPFEVGYDRVSVSDVANTTGSRAPSRIHSVPGSWMARESKRSRPETPDSFDQRIRPSSIQTTDDDCSVATSDPVGPIIPVMRYRHSQQSGSTISSRLVKGFGTDQHAHTSVPRWAPPTSSVFELDEEAADVAKENYVGAQSQYLKSAEIDKGKSIDRQPPPQIYETAPSSPVNDATDDDMTPAMLGFRQFDDLDIFPDRNTDTVSLDGSDGDMILWHDDDLIRPSRRDRDSVDASSRDPEAERVERYEESGQPSEWNDVTGVVTTQNANVEGVGEKLSLMKTVQALWSGSAVNWGPIEYPFGPTDHVIEAGDPQDQTFFPVSIVREDEPSSIIAATLASYDFQQKMESLRYDMRDIDLDSEHSGEEMRTYGHPNPSEEYPEGSYYYEEVLRRKSGGHHLRYHDRFILKELSRPESNAFIKFAPEYFSFMAEAIFKNLPTLLAKIYGVYRIGFTNNATGKTFKMELLVMENLFYNRNCSKLFDLKGSTRNRHTNATGRDGEVLMDENLIELSRENAIHIRPHAYRLFKTGVWNDCLFLGNHNVMDYSLLVGIDDNSKELVVGIVDFIRTYTWDKRLETWVKETGLLGGTGLTPTIVTPKQYKRRFRDAMMRYFQMVPDKWHWWEPPSKKDGQVADGDAEG